MIYLWYLLKVTGVLVFLVAVMYGILYVMRKYLFSVRGSNINPLTGKTVNSPIEIVTTQVIMPRKYVSVVKVKDRVYILGVTDHHITLLDSVDEEDMPNEILDELQQQKPSFIEYLKNSFPKK